MADASEGDLSFDPKSWGRKPSVPETPEPAAATPDASLPPLFAAARPRRAAAAPVKRGPPVLALAGGAVAVVAVAGAALLLRPHAPAPATAPAASSSAQAYRRGLALPTLSGLADALKAERVPAAEAARIAEAAQGALGAGSADLRMVLSLSPGSPATFQAVELRRADGSGVLIKPAGDGTGAMASEALASDLQVRVKVVRGEMDANSFYTSAVAAGIVDQLVPSFAAAFAFDFDFQREIRPGDIFEAVFEHKVDGNGQTVGGERLVYASLQTQTKSRALYLYRPADGQEAWYDGNGVSIIRGLMKTPVEGARISSSFGPRMHPVLGYTRQHKGTDFAVPVGTTVYASGDGTVEFVGPRGEFGNYVRVRHSPTLETAYAHLSAFGQGIAVGAMVHQGQALALSGNTGLSTGPHLHYEVLVGGEQVDSMTFETTSGHSLKGEELSAFQKERDRIDALRAAQNG